MRGLAALALLCAVPVLAHPSIGIVRGAGGEIFYSDLEQVWRLGADGRKSIAVPRVHSHEDPTARSESTDPGPAAYS